MDPRGTPEKSTHFPKPQHCHFPDFPVVTSVQKNGPNTVSESTVSNTELSELGVARGLLQERPLPFHHGNIRVKSWQPMSNSWSTSSQPDFVRALGRRKTVRNRPSKILYTDLLKSWPTLSQLLADSPPHGKLQGSSLQ